VAIILIVIVINPAITEQKGSNEMIVSSFRVRGATDYFEKHDVHARALQFQRIVFMLCGARQC